MTNTSFNEKSPTLLKCFAQFHVIIILAIKLVIYHTLFCNGKNRSYTKKKSSSHQLIVNYSIQFTQYSNHEKYWASFSFRNQIIVPHSKRAPPVDQHTAISRQFISMLSLNGLHGLTRSCPWKLCSRENGECSHSLIFSGTFITNLYFFPFVRFETLHGGSITKREFYTVKPCRYLWFESCWFWCYRKPLLVFKFGKFLLHLCCEYNYFSIYLIQKWFIKLYLAVKNCT